MKTRVDSFSDQGTVRDNNEDFVITDEKLGLYILCDGMGGHAAGQVAAKLAAETVQKEIESAQLVDPDVTTCRALVKNAISSGCAKIFKAGEKNPDYRGMGTTITLVWIQGCYAIVGHVGDTRLYLKRGSQFDQLTRDHTLMQDMLEKGAASEDEVKISPYRHVLTRALGTQPSVAVDLLHFELIPGDSIVLCSDGVTDVFSEPGELAAIVGGGSENQAKFVTDSAINRGSEDNASAIILHLDGEEQADSAESERIEVVRLTRDVLKEMYLFADLAIDELVRVVERCELVNCTAGEVLIREGEPSDAMYVILDGFLNVDQRQRNLAGLGRGNHVGEMALLLGSGRTASVQSLTEARLLRLQRTDFELLVREHPGLGVKLLNALAKELAARLKATNSIVVR